LAQHVHSLGLYLPLMASQVINFKLQLFLWVITIVYILFLSSPKPQTKVVPEKEKLLSNFKGKTIFFIGDSQTRNLYFSSSFLFDTTPKKVLNLTVTEKHKDLETYSADYDTKFKFFWISYSSALSEFLQDLDCGDFDVAYLNVGLWDVLYHDKITISKDIKTLGESFREFYQRCTTATKR